MQGKVLPAILIILVILETGFIITRLNTTIKPSTSAVCDVGSLCLQTGKNEGGILGVAEVTAHSLGKKSFNVMDGGTESCNIMAIDSANDPKVLAEIGADANGQYLFSVPDNEVSRYNGTTASTPASLIVYISERKGSDSSICSTRVHIVN